MVETRHEKNRLGDLVGKSPAMQAVFSRIQKAAAWDMPVILFGPTGSGKHLAARTIHDLSLRRNGPFVPVVTSGDPDRLRLRLFGDPDAQMPEQVQGLLAAAGGGSLYIDEVAHLDHAHQVALLRSLEPLASGGPDIRLVTATCQVPEALLASGRIREDFHYRFHVIPVRMPALADRQGDLPLLAATLTRRMGLCPLTVNDMTRLSRRTFAGNVRELAEALRKLASTPVVESSALDASLAGRSLKEAVAEFEHAVIQNTLDDTRGNLARAAARLGVDRKALLAKIKAFGLQLEPRAPSHRP